MLHLRIPKQIYDYMLTDIRRKNEFADERVGFLFINKGQAEESILLLASDYLPVADSNYIKDNSVGAKINSTAIREVMQKILDSGHGVLHVHMHEFIGNPCFSKVDVENIQLLIPSFKSVAPKAINGALLIQNKFITSLVWLPREEKPRTIDRLTIIGRPLEFFGRY